jgi:hypothetical protein
MSYRELSAWGSLVITLIIFGNYFREVGLSGDASTGLLAGTVVAMIVVEIIYTVMISLWRREELRDERDRLIELRAASNASWISTNGLIILVTAVLVYRWVNGDEILGSSLAWVNAIVFILIASECVRFASQGIGYRRGA